MKTDSHSAHRRIVQYLTTIHPGQRIHRMMMEKYLPDHSSRLLELMVDDEEIQKMVCPLDTGTASSRSAPVRYSFPLLRRRFSGNERFCAVVDLNNLAWTLPPPVILILLNDLFQWGVSRQHLVSDASIPKYLPAEIRESLTRLPGTQQVITAPAGVPADRIILEVLQQEEGFVLSNDTFRDWRTSFPQLRRSLWRRRVTVQRDEQLASGYTLGDAGIELTNPPPG